ncbi:unnamed protein product [Ectocarpus sp. CCAP 1310/34]|nr:unnamed protein product [Ectocarpus sp. CCAP 1310/34]
MPATDRHGSQPRLLRERPYATPRREATRLRGRVDSAKAEELLAGLGFNVDEEARSKGNGQQRGRRRKRAGGNNEAIRDAEWAPTAPRADIQKGLTFLEAADFDVPAEDRLAFERNGHAVTRGVFSSKQLNALRPSIVQAFELQEMNALRQKVSVWFGDDDASELETAPQLRARLKRLTPEEVPFLQVFNMFRKDGPFRETIERVVLSPRLAHIAAQLLGCQRLRLYQDSTFCKRPGDGQTRWHSDLNMAPLDCNDFVTAWIPLEEIPAKREGGSPLVFASRSHRDFALNHWRDSRLREDLTGRYREKDHAPLAAGDITWHHGWTLHSSPGNRRETRRVALAVSYFRDGTCLLSDTAGRSPDPEDKWSYGDWVGDLPVGGVVKHPSVPLVWNGGRPVR